MNSLPSAPFFTSFPSFSLLKGIALICNLKKPIYFKKLNFKNLSNVFSSLSLLQGLKLRVNISSFALLPFSIAYSVVEFKNSFCVYSLLRALKFFAALVC